MPKTTPRMIFDNWPDSDLLGLPRPRIGETYLCYCRRLERELKQPDSLSCDRLFHFAMAELAGQDANETLRRLGNAIRDLMALSACVIKTGLWQPPGRRAKPSKE